MNKFNNIRFYKLNIIFTVFMVLFGLNFNSYASGNDPKAVIKLISSVEAVGDQNKIDIGLHYKFVETWHTYWRSPGLTGYGVELDWTGSKNIKSTKIHWPAPEWFTVLGIPSVGYSDEVVLPITITPEVPGKPIEIKLKTISLVCNPGRCIPYDEEFSLKIPAGIALPTNDAKLILSYKDKVPELNPSDDITIQPSITLKDTATIPQVLKVTAENKSGFKKPTVFVEFEQKLFVSEPMIEVSEDKKTATFVIHVYRNEFKNSLPKKALLNSDIKITVVDGSKAKVIESKIELEGANDFIKTFITVLIFAFLGGFILNFMPCVLPVLSIKIFAVLKKSHVEQAKIRKNFLATSYGIISCFLLLGVIAIALKLLGTTIGWGIQFQSPYFIIGISLVLILFTSNLWGFFEIPLPRFLAAMTMMEKSKSEFWQNFFTGMFVTVLATPCTAPFLATAISYAFSRGIIEILVMFTTMGVGLASLYLLVAAFPRIATALPKPGRWMITLRLILGGLIMATVIWLLSVLYAQIGIVFVSLITLLFIAIMLVLYLQERGFVNFFHGHVFYLVAVLSVVSLYLPYQYKQEIAKVIKDDVWLAFDESKIHEYVAEGRIVFIDVTADWCLTCKANEILVLNTTETMKYFKQNNIVLMKADWTKPNEVIASYLKKFDEYGIPFYAVYGPGKPKGLKLSQILTLSQIKRAVEKASEN